jgi:hypothetical protein
MSHIRGALGPTSDSREFGVLVMTKLDGLINQLDGDEIWDLFWDAINGEFALLGFMVSYLTLMESSTLPALGTWCDAPRYQFW